MPLRNIASQLDMIASELELIDPRVALALDRISDLLDRVAAEWPKSLREGDSKVEFKKGGPYYKMPLTQKTHLIGHTSTRPSEFKDFKDLQREGLFTSENQAFAFKDENTIYPKYTVYFNIYTDKNTDEKELKDTMDIIGAKEVTQEDINSLPSLYYYHEPEKDKGHYAVTRGYEISNR